MADKTEHRWKILSGVLSGMLNFPVRLSCRGKRAATRLTPLFDELLSFVAV